MVVPKSLSDVNVIIEGSTHAPGGEHTVASDLHGVATPSPARGPAAEAPAIAAILHRRPRACQGPPVARSRGRLTVPASPEQYRDRWTGSERWRVDGNPAEGCRRRGDAM